MRYRLAILDFDGTLADSFPFFISVFNQIADQHGFRRILPGEVEGLRHHGAREMMRHLEMPAWKLPMVSKTFIGLMKENTSRIALFPGIESVLHQLAQDGVCLTVVSSNSDENVKQVLGPQLSGLITQFECGMSIFGKASRIRSVLKKAAVSPQHAIYIGDQSSDAEAARKAGVAFGAVHWGYAPIEALRRVAPEVEFEHPAALARLSGPLSLSA